jgi:act minimal PKS ketosynthase (KS/KS alpha)
VPRYSARRRVVITGVGPVTPIGVGRASFWSAARQGRAGTRKLKALPGNFSVDNLRSRVVASVCDDLLPGGGDEAWGGRHLRLGHLGLRLALEDADLDSLPSDGALIVGSAIGGTASMETSFRAMDKDGVLDPDRAPADLMDQMSFHRLACDLSNACGSPDTVLTISTGCTAGLDALAAAFDLVRRGDVAVAIAGAAEAPLTPVVFAAFDAIGALSCRNNEPGSASRPFDEGRDGFVLGEGAAFLVLEDAVHAVRRGAHVYAEVLGAASLSNGYHMTDLPEDGAALAECICCALEQAGVSPDEVDHVDAHGSSTPQNDVCETNAIKRALRERCSGVTVTSLKSMTGHALGAANAIEAAACALVLDRQYVYPTANLERPGRGCDLDYVPRQGRARPVRTVVKLSNGFSGIHSAIVLAAAGFRTPWATAKLRNGIV